MARPNIYEIVTPPELEMQRVQPPDSLSETEKIEWQCIVDAQPADWFHAANAKVLH
jgi:hypothetical protein